MSDLSRILDDVDALLGAAQSEAELARDGQQGTDPRTDAQASGLDGKIEVRLGADGRVRELVLADEVMSMTAPQLAREIASVINVAWGMARSDDPAAAVVSAVDAAALASRMSQLRQESAQSMSRITGALTDTLAKIDRRLS